MAKCIVVLVFFSLLMAATQISGSSDLEEAQALVENICRGNEKLATIHFYVQETLFGPNATIFEVARGANITSISPTEFGRVQVVDDLLTAGPDPNSEKLGRVQGILMSSDLATLAISTSSTFVFTAGKYNGSTLSFLGRVRSFDLVREFAVVGGTGALRFARGYALSTITELNLTYPGKIVVEFTVYTTVVHA